MRSINRKFPTMTTIYFDKQIFSYLFKSKEDKHRNLLQKIIENKKDFIFLYSDAHLHDLYQDSTTLKYEELKFMKEIVDSNHLVYIYPCIQADYQEPLVGFTSLKPLEDTTWVEDLDFENPQGELESLVLNAIDIWVQDSYESLSPLWFFERIPIKTGSSNRKEVLHWIKDVNKNYFGRRDLYKSFRNNSIKAYNPYRKRANKFEDVDNIIKECFPKSSFDEITNATLHQLGISAQYHPIKYMIEYNYLDSWGICPEKGKTVATRNMLIDSFHGFMASYCDVLVCNDSNMREKNRILYERYNIETQIYTLDEFIDKFDEAIANKKKTAKEYIDETINDHTNGKTVKVETYNNTTYTHIQTSHSYFGYFNQMVDMSSENGWAIILSKRNGLNQSLLFKEIEIIVNRISKVFYEIGYEYQPFCIETESEQLKEDKWISRCWETPNFIMRLDKIQGQASLCLIIYPLTN